MDEEYATSKQAEYANGQERSGMDRFYDITAREGYTLKRNGGISTIEQLTALTMRELMNVPSIGWTKAKAIERSMARYGFYLVDSDREALARDIAMKDAENDPAALPPAPETPEEIRSWASERLLEIGDRLMQDGRSQFNLAHCIDRGDQSESKSLIRYANAKLTHHGMVKTIAVSIGTVRGCR